jgi:epoxyqueuosine reductase
MTATEDINRLIKIKGAALDFDLVGICRAEYDPESHDRLLNWLNSGYQADLGYLERNPRIRSDPRLLFSAAKSIISVGLNYYNEPEYDAREPYISIYARCLPYQDIMKAKLGELLEYIKTFVPEAAGKIAVDTSPTFDRVWAARAGLGWQGKNSLLINKQIGSFVFLGELFLNIDLEPDQPEPDRCADCSRCFDACPTGALVEPYILDVSKCISYLTLSADLDSENSFKIGNNLMGCDFCQLACPYNQRAAKNDLCAVAADDIANNFSRDELVSLTESDFNSRFMGTVIAKKGFNRFTQNARAVQDNLRLTEGSN